MTVRRIQADQVQAYGETLIELLHHCTDISFSGEVSRDFYTEKLKALHGYLQTGKACLLGAFQGEVLVGFLWGYPLADPMGEKFHIAYFAVLPEFENQGIGTRLLQEAQTQARKMGMERAELLVSRDNAKAVDFYCSHGFQIQRYVLQNEFLKEDGEKRGLCSEQI